jgi:hypothetical protein
MAVSDSGRGGDQGSGRSDSGGVGLRRSNPAFQLVSSVYL